MDRIIKVTGRGKLAIRPDQIRLIITLKGIEKEYVDAVKKSSEVKQSLNQELAALGFEERDLKTLRYNVDTQYESYQTKSLQWKQRFAGYEYTHHMKLEFPIDNARLGKVLYLLAHTKGKPEIQIEYTSSDPSAAKNELLARAVKDSREKALILTAAAGTVLGELMTIDYSWGEIEFVSRPMDTRMLCSGNAEAPMMAKSYDIDIEPDDIEVTDTVTVVWALL